MDSGSTIERTTPDYPPLPRVLHTLGASRQGVGPRLAASGPAFRFAARLLPRTGVLRRGLLAPSYGDAAGRVLGDPVRPFMRWRRRAFPIATQTLSVMRSVAAQGRNASTSEVSRSPIVASHLSQLIARVPVGLPVAADPAQSARRAGAPATASPSTPATPAAWQAASSAHALPGNPGAVGALGVAPPLGSPSASTSSNANVARSAITPSVPPTASRPTQSPSVTPTPAARTSQPATPTTPMPLAQ